MNKSAFMEMMSTQDSHWWFKGRRQIIRRVLSSLAMPSNPRILEIGCGTGGNLLMLLGFGVTDGIEMDEGARKYASEISGITVLDGWLPDGLFNVKKHSYDVVCLFDVLEHVENDIASLANVREYLISDNERQGILLITVPAYQWMYGAHDQKLSHYRRYSKKELRAKLNAAGYTVKYLSYMNTVLFPLMLLSRLIGIFKQNDIGTSIPPQFINSAMYNLFSIETLMIPQVSLPFGGSLIALCEAA